MAADIPTIHEENNLTNELRVTFFPPLYLQRRMWVLDILRKERYTDILDVGCGEGQLLQTLSNPASWLSSPPESILPPDPSLSSDPASRYNPTDDPIPNLHPCQIAGLDILERDLMFAIDATRPPAAVSQDLIEEASSPVISRINVAPRPRWEDLTVKLWQGGLEVINEEFVGKECIVSMEVIEHLPPEVFPFFAPILLGVYHPKVLLITTPSYTYNTRFTAPDAPSSARKGFPDPTGRTQRIFRHHDHKFEWTLEEFNEWCDKVAQEWGYDVKKDSIGRAQELDEWGRDTTLGGASQVAAFRRIDNESVKGVDREKRGREVTRRLRSESSLNYTPHTLLVEHHHSAHPKSKEPVPFSDIGNKVKSIMQGYDESSMRLEEFWYEKDVAEMCGGYIEVLVRSVEVHDDLTLRKELREGTSSEKYDWMVDLVGGVPKELWPVEGEHRMELPVEDAYIVSSSDEETEGDESADADVSWNEWEADDQVGWGATQWSTVRTSKETGWGSQSDEKIQFIPDSLFSAASSTAGWDGDHSDSGDTTS